MSLMTKDTSLIVQEKGVYFAKDFDNRTEARCVECDLLINVHSVKEHGADCRLTKQFDCPDCTYSCNREVNLKVHRTLQHATHDRIKACSLCKKKFTRDAAFRGHVKSHALLDHLPCKICKQEFETKAELARHERHNHGEEGGLAEALICCKCEEVFSPFDREAHRQRHSYQNLIERKIAIKEKKKLKPEPVKKYQCSQCEKTFRRPKELERHAVVHSGEKAFQCTICDTLFRHRNGLKSHMKIHEEGGIKTFKCRLCSVSFNTKYNLHRHVKKCHIDVARQMTESDTEKRSEEMVEATVVPVVPLHVPATFHDVLLNDIDYNESSYDERSLYGDDENDVNWMDDSPSLTGRILDEAAAQGDRGWLEEVDGKELAQQLFQPLVPIKERLLVVPEESLRCPCCFHSFSALEQLLRHFLSLTPLDSHHNLSQFTCPVCNMEMYGATAADHLISHGISIPPPVVPPSSSPKRRPFQCQECAKRFQKKIDLDRHFRIHTGVRPFHCPHCSSSFNLESSLRRHEKRHTEVTARHECSLCNRSFYSRSALRTHMITHSVACSFCPLIFKSDSERDVHITQQHVRESVQKRGDRTGGTLLPSLPGGISTLSKICRISAPRPLARCGPSAFSLLPPPQTLPHPQVRVTTFNAEGEGLAVEIGREKKEMQQISLPSTSKTEKKNVPISFTVPCQLMESLQAERALLRAPLDGCRVVSLHPDNALQTIQSSSRVTTQAVAPWLEDNEQTLRSSSYAPVHVECSSPFMQHCQVCDESFSTREESERHIVSEDHETAQLMAPLNQSQGATPPIFCKLCGNRFSTMAPLVAHIRQEHESNHPKKVSHHHPHPASMH